MFSISVVRGEIWRRSGIKNKNQKNIGKQTRIRRAVKKEKEDWIGTQFEEIKTCLNKSNSAGEGSNLRETG